VASCKEKDKKREGCAAIFPEMKAAASARQWKIFHPKRVISNPGENPISAQLFQAILLLQDKLKAAG